MGPSDVKCHYQAAGCPEAWRKLHTKQTTPWALCPLARNDTPTHDTLARGDDETNFYFSQAGTEKVPWETVLLFRPGA